MADFQYNGSMDKTIERSPFEIAVGLQPRKTIELVSLPILVCGNVEATNLA